jgi:hypothetical protein
MMIVIVSLLAGLSIPLTLFSTNAEEKPTQAAAATTEKPGPGQPAPGQQGAAQSKAQLEILDAATTLTVQISNPPGSHGIMAVYLRNDGDGDISTLEFSAALQDENGKAYSLSASPSPGEAGVRIGAVESQDYLAGHSIKPFELQIKLDTGLPRFENEAALIPHTLTGHLVVVGRAKKKAENMPAENRPADKKPVDKKAGKSKPAEKKAAEKKEGEKTEGESQLGEKLIKSRPLKLIPLGPSQRSADSVWFGLIAASAVIIVSALFFKLKLNQRMGLPEWTASGSLATNLTAVGTVLMTILASPALPLTTHTLQKSEYATLGLLFGVLVFLAPIIYNSIRVPSTRDQTPTTAYEGYVGMFLLASLVTLWAVFGQLATIWYAVAELWQAHYMPYGSLVVFRACIVVVTLLLFIYAFVAIYVKVRKSKTPVRTPAQPAPEISKPAEPTTVALPKWRLL